jgi:hypothetical protein
VERVDVVGDVIGDRVQRLGRHVERPANLGPPGYGGGHRSGGDGLGMRNDNEERR